MSSTTSAIQQIHQLDVTKRTQAYLTLIDQLASSQDAKGVGEVFTYVLTSEGETPSGRANVQIPVMLGGIARLLDEKGNHEHNLDADDMIPVMNNIIALVKQQSELAEVYYEATRTLSESYQACDDHLSAAAIQNAFSFTSLGSSLPNITRADKINWHIRTAELYLHGGASNAGSAQQALQHAASLLNDDNDRTRLPPELKSRYTIVYSRIACQLCRFLGAASGYCEIADMPLSSVVSESRRQKAIQTAVLCAVLAPISVNRTRILTKLHADPRSKQSPLHNYMEKTLFQRIITRDEYNQLEQIVSSSQPQMLAQLPNGRRITQQSWIEHNIAAASRLYATISVSSLADLVGCTPEETEKMVVDMVGGGQMDARIDQVDGYVIFGSGDGGHGKNGGDSGNTSQAQHQWYKQIDGLCKDIVAVCNQINKENPKVKT